MTRFREEYYDTAAHRAWVKVQRATDARRQGSKQVWIAPPRTQDEERRALRAEYFKAKAKRGYAPSATQARWKLDG